MQTEFRNIDDFRPGKFEGMGALKGKRWYIDKKQKGLFKPQRKEYGDRKVFCGNHYGEVMGYFLALGGNIPSCKAELAHLSNYYEDEYKVKYGGKPEPKDGCIIYSELKNNQILKHGLGIIESFSFEHREKIEELIKKDKSRGDKNDNLEVVLEAIEFATKSFYKKKPQYTKEYVQKKVTENQNRAIQMMVYDCVNGNNDRHDENWAMVTEKEDIAMYPLYDNERVLGLYENQNVIEKAIKEDKIEQVSQELLFSRMKVPGEQKKRSNYKDVLRYLAKHYREETQRELREILIGNKPQQVKEKLQSCEGLPSCYVEFGSKMYENRYEFAKELYKSCKAKEEEQSQDIR